MTGFDLEVVRDTLLPSFNPKSFDAFLLTKLNTKRTDIVAGGGLKDVILEVLQIADEEGWDRAVDREGGRGSSGHPRDPRTREEIRAGSWQDNSRH